MNHKKLVIMGIRVWLIMGFAAMARELPLQNVWRPECKWMHRQELSDDCKIAIDAPMEQSMSKLLISVLRGASYDDNHTAGVWSHPSTDFATNKGTPVYTIGDGEVINARYRAGYGNSITVLHDFKWETIYSNYSHLSVMNVRPWQKVEQWMKIGEVGRSGFTIWPYGFHLDFQITTAQSPSHPYGFHDCKEWGYLKVVQEGLCKEKLEAYTIDPLQFFATYANKDIRPVWRKRQNTQQDSSSLVITQIAQTQKVVEDTVVKWVVSSIPKQVNKKRAPEDTVVIVKRSEPEAVLVVESIQEHGSSVKDATQQWTLSLKPGFDISWEVLWAMPAVGQIIPVKFTVTQDNEPLSGKLDDRVIISWSDAVQTLPWSFSRVYKGTKTIFVRVNNSWTYRLDVRSGEIQLWQILLVVK